MVRDALMSIYRAPTNPNTFHLINQNKYVNAYVPIYGALAGLYTERAGLRKDKKEEAAREADRKQAAAYGRRHEEQQRAQRGEAEAKAALAAEKLKEIKL